MQNIFQQNNTDLDALDVMFNKTPSTDIFEGGQNPLKNLDISKVLEDVVTNIPEKKTNETTTSDGFSVTVDPLSNKGVLDVLDKAIGQTLPTTETENGETQIQQVDETLGGRPKVEKDALLDYLKGKVESQEFGVPDDYDQTLPLADYLKKLPTKQVYEILDQNWKVKEEEIRNSAPREYFESLPDPAKDVAIYAQQGGTDWDDFYLRKGRQMEIAKLDPLNEEHQVPIARAYLKRTTQMSSSQIEEQIEDWKATDKLPKKASEFKPALDSIQQESVNAKIREAEQQKKKSDEISNFYIHNVGETLSKNELAGIKLDKKFADQLYTGLTQVAPGPFSGRPLNLLDALIEHKQFVEPDYESLALATWLLQDKVGFMKSMQQVGANQATADQVKLIKLEQGIKSGGGATVNKDEEIKQVRKLPNNKNILKRTA